MTFNPNIGWVADSYKAKLSALQEKLQASNAGSKIIYKVADVGDYDAVDAAVASAVEELGRIDILINNVRYTLCHRDNENARLIPTTGRPRARCSSSFLETTYRLHQHHERH